MVGARRPRRDRPDPAAVLERLVALPDVVATRGNTERYTLTRDRPPPHAGDVLAHPELIDLFADVEGSFAWTRGALASTGWLPWLADLPLEVRIELPDGTRVLGVHGTPGRGRRRRDQPATTRGRAARGARRRGEPTSWSWATPIDRPTAGSVRCGR